jgi:hypothetical protein
MRRLILFAVLLAACAERRPAIEELPPFIQPQAGAMVLHHDQDNLHATVIYRIDACYPATREIAEITSRIPKAWTILREDALNPGHPTSHVTGWISRDANIRAWEGQWTSPDGMVLVYQFEFGNHRMCDMDVVASMFTPEEVARLRARR